MQRISVVGSSGSGKTTMAKALADALSLPRLELDSLHNQAGWTTLPGDEFLARATAFAEGPRWVIDGNYDSYGVLDAVWERAEGTIVSCCDGCGEGTAAVLACAHG